MLENTGQKAD